MHYINMKEFSIFHIIYGTVLNCVTDRNVWITVENYKFIFHFLLVFFSIFKIFFKLLIANTG